MNRPKYPLIFKPQFRSNFLLQFYFHLVGGKFNIFEGNNSTNTDSTGVFWSERSDSSVLMGSGATNILKESHTRLLPQSEGGAAIFAAAYIGCQ